MKQNTAAAATHPRSQATSRRATRLVLADRLFANSDIPDGCGSSEGIRKLRTSLLPLYACAPSHFVSCPLAQTARSFAQARNSAISSARVIDSGTVDESAVSRSWLLSS